VAAVLVGAFGSWGRVCPHCAAASLEDQGGWGKAREGSDLAPLEVSPSGGLAGSFSRRISLPGWRSWSSRSAGGGVYQGRTPASVLVSLAA